MDVRRRRTEKQEHANLSSDPGTGPGPGPGAEDRKSTVKKEPVIRWCRARKSCSGGGGADYFLERHEKWMEEAGGSVGWERLPNPGFMKP